MSSYQQNLPTLVTEMAGKDTLCGWDVLVSYNENQINSLLQARASDIGMLRPLTWNVSVTGNTCRELERMTTAETPIDPFPYQVTIIIQLSNPTIQFQDSTGFVTLTCPFTGTYTYFVAGKSEVTPFPAGLQLQLSTSLVNVSGSWDSNSDFQPGPNTPSPSQWVVLMDPGADIAQAVCIDFTNLTANVSNTPSGNTGEGNLATFNSWIIGFVTAHFQGVSLRYYLAGVSNQYDPNYAGSEVLQPTSFCFTVVRGDAANNSPGTLNMRIGLKGGSGQREGQAHLVFAPNGQEVDPIPSGNNASVIFSHDTMANLFLKVRYSVSLYFE